VHGPLSNRVFDGSSRFVELNKLPDGIKRIIILNCSFIYTSIQSLQNPVQLQFERFALKVFYFRGVQQVTQNKLIKTSLGLVLGLDKHCNVNKHCNYYFDSFIGEHRGLTTTISLFMCDLLYIAKIKPLKCNERHGHITGSIAHILWPVETF
jgi:hypothetical protein